MAAPLRVEVAMVELERERLELESKQRIVVARLNALMHRPPGAALAPPPPPSEPELVIPPPIERLLASAMDHRAERRAIEAEVAAAEASERAAARDYYPDITVMGSYSSMWDRIEHQIMLGIEVPIPLERDRRRGAGDEARARAGRGRSEATLIDDTIATEVEQARLEVIAAIDIVELYRDRLLPAARAQIEAAQAAYEADRDSFVALISAEDALRDAELAFHTSVAELSKRRARLDRAVGTIPGLGAEGAR
jgi:outer membrane protein TolC